MHGVCLNTADHLRNTADILEMPLNVPPDYRRQARNGLITTADHLEVPQTSSNASRLARNGLGTHNYLRPLFSSFITEIGLLSDLFKIFFTLL